MEHHRRDATKPLNGAQSWLRRVHPRSAKVVIERTILLALLLLSPAGRIQADEKLNRVMFVDDAKQTRTVDGKIVTQAQDGGLLLLGRDGRLWTVTPDQLKQRDVTDNQFKPFTAAELGQEIIAELKQAGSAGPFEIVTTKHYVICSSASKEYAQWCGTLFERLLASFTGHWKRTKSLKLHEPAFPLPAIVLADERQFVEFASKDYSPELQGVTGYYSILKNRTVLYDLTAGSGKTRPRSNAEINSRLASSTANVSAVIHEATHQIAFNCGLHTRLADNPLWLTEGMAMYFEIPDLRSRVGWRTVGKPNDSRLRLFRQSLASRRKPDSLITLISSDDRFRNGETIGDAYAESWALSYFLMKTKRKAYTDYLSAVAAKPRLSWDQPDDRLREFQATFGEDLNQLDRDFVRYMNRLRR